MTAPDLISTESMSFTPPPGGNQDFNSNMIITSSDQYVGSGAIDSDMHVPRSSPNTTGNTNSTASAHLPEGSSSSIDNNSVSFWKKIICCWSLEAYRPYFDVDTIDVKERIIASITYCNVEGGFKEHVLQKNGSGPDLYGPWWISTTLLFFLAVTSNLSMYLHSDSSDDFEYDITHIARAMTITFTFSFGLPVVLFFLFQCIGGSISVLELVCLYGYSLVPFLPATILCLVPFDILMWTSLLAATIVSLLLIIKNVAGSFTAIPSYYGGSKNSVVFGGLALCHLIFLLVIKFSFYHHKKHSPS